ncbi:MAG: GIY-YIG nuclease family protein [Candidatus Melainabacteria bacterium]|nr:GIY-YIG nuclease family protein [Candidatus Melainabacteria bacterium]
MNSGVLPEKKKRGKTSGGDFRLIDTPVLILDCQTTGASPATGNLLELAYCLTSAASSEDPSIVSYLIQQPEGEPIPPRIVSLTGIDNDDMVGAQSPSDVLMALEGALGLLPSPPLCLIHYARFELPFLTELFMEYGRHGLYEGLPFAPVCTFEIARRLYPDLPSRGIRALGGFLGIELDDLKRAPGHVGTTSEIWKHLAARLEEEGVTTRGELQEFLSTRARRRTGKLQYQLSPEKRLNLPDNPGVYRMLNRQGRVLYVGKATSLRSRVNSHFRGRKRKTSSSFELLTQVYDLDFTVCRTPFEAALLEVEEIKRHDPPYNASLKNNDRRVWFYSDDFESAATTCDDVHHIGPFSSESTIGNIRLLCDAIEEGEVSPELLYLDSEVEPEIIEAGLEMFFARHDLAPFTAIGARALLLIGMRLWRSWRNYIRLVEALTDEEREEESERGPEDGLSQESQEDSSEFSDEVDVEEADENEDENEDEEENEEISPEDVCARIESLLTGAARHFLQGKELKALCQCRITYGADDLEIVVRDGLALVEAAGISREDRVSESADKSSGFDIERFDRLRVLLTELAALKSRGEKVTVEPYICFLSR